MSYLGQQNKITFKQVKIWATEGILTMAVSRGELLKETLYGE